MMPELQVEFLVMSWQQEGTYIKIEAFEGCGAMIQIENYPLLVIGGFQRKCSVSSQMQGVSRSEKLSRRLFDAAILNPGSKEQDKQVEIEIYTGETLSRGYFCTRTEEKLKMMNVTGSTWLIDIMPVI
ncbi:hypothetical protein MLD38_005400 [Melastoma candidum]|uniref:Uncharacterized protein n=1 Tax=Melastoma candidum TaxID=119954 RepID=A0ACB9RJM5_9MYRT|nr:hypothetical protein MLD38_005400 [Melastoma candidum]